MLGLFSLVTTFLETYLYADVASLLAATVSYLHVIVSSSDESPLNVVDGCDDKKYLTAPQSVKPHVVKLSHGPEKIATDMNWC